LVNLAVSECFWPQIPTAVYREGQIYHSELLRWPVVDVWNTGINSPSGVPSRSDPQKVEASLKIYLFFPVCDIGV
jgi:hypothetical protein